MHRSAAILILTWVAYATLLPTTPAWAHGRKPPRVVQPTFNGWVVYWDVDAGAQAVAHRKKLWEEISLFAYQFDSSGNLVPATPEVHGMKSLMPTDDEGRPRYLMTVVNDIATTHGSLLKDPACVHAAILTPEARATHVAQLVALSEKFDGIDIDYERVNSSDRDAFTLFIKELSGALHARKKWLSVVLQPRTETTEENDSSGAGSIDWEAITPHVDRIKVMAYLYHYSSSEAGSIAPLKSVVDLAKYSQTIVAPEKLCVVLHLGGFDWPESGSGHSIEYAQARDLADLHSQKIKTDLDSQSGTFQYTDDKGQLHTVWIETAAGLKAKVSALGAQGVPSVGFWRLGAGDPTLPETLVPIQ